MDSYDRDELIEKLEDLIIGIHEIEEDFGEELKDCSLELMDSRISLSLILDAVKAIKCPDDEEEDTFEDT